MQNYIEAQKMIQNKIICISGASGVGKTTIAKLLLCLFNSKEAMIVSGDDSHKWERNNEHWKQYTHLNPAANNLENEYESLSCLKRGEKIVRKTYNHSNGLFDEPKIVEPCKNIIYEGLHALYDERIKDLSDLKIYVDTDEELKIAWKINRDLKKRGYTEQQVLDNIQRRIVDEEKYILPQKKYADAIVSFTFNETGISLKYELKDDRFVVFFENIKRVYDLNKEFIRICKLLSEDKYLIQNKGGNVSTKFGNKLMITSSGVDLSSISIFDGYCVLQDLSNPIIKSGRPSMEIDSHLYLGPAVIHTHPVYLLSILCSQENEKILQDLYKNYDFKIVDYFAPGKKVAEEINKIEKNIKIIFLKNHGLFVAENDLQKALDITREVEEIARRFIQSNTNKYSEHECEENNLLFPDAVVLKEKNKILNKIILENIINANMKPRFLNKEEVQELLGMEEEKYRANLI
jgi:uridine kinase/ribulose-5-phosphate 4-epimerase/fuculose-1-phosphate aldolase